MLWERHQARCFARLKVMSELMDFMFVRLKDSVVLFGASDSSNGKCGDNGLDTHSGMLL